GDGVRAVVGRAVALARELARPVRRQGTRRHALVYGRDRVPEDRAAGGREDEPPEAAAPAARLQEDERSAYVHVEAAGRVGDRVHDPRVGGEVHHQLDAGEWSLHRRRVADVTHHELGVGPGQIRA